MSLLYTVAASVAHPSSPDRVTSHFCASIISFQFGPNDLNINGVKLPMLAARLRASSYISVISELNGIVSFRSRFPNATNLSTAKMLSRIGVISKNNGFTQIEPKSRTLCIIEPSSMLLSRIEVMVGDLNPFILG